jgi:membrane-associated phospholipid phosphatase
MKFLRIVFLFIPFSGNAQVDTVSVKQWDIVRGLDAVGTTFSSPARWKGKDWITLGGVIVGTAVVTLADEPVREIMLDAKTPFLHGFERVGFHYGKPYSAIAITGGFYLTGIILKDEWAKETGLMLASGLTTGSIMQTILKTAVGRARPATELGNYSAEPFSSKPAFHAFPSGHTSVALTISLVLARQVKSVPLKIVFYSLSALTATSRLYSDAHWISDITFGGAIGWFCADAAIKCISSNRYRSVVRKQKAFTVKVYPYPGGLSLRAVL